MNKKTIAAIIIVVLIIVAIILINVLKKDNTEVQQEETPKEEHVTVLSDGTKLNNSSKLNSKKELDGLVFENIQLTDSNGQSVLLADVTNTTEKETKMTFVKITFIDQKGKELGTVDGMIIPLKPGQKTQFNVSMTNDYSNAYDYKIVKK